MNMHIHIHFALVSIMGCDVMYSQVECTPEVSKAEAGPLRIYTSAFVCDRASPATDRAQSVDQATVCPSTCVAGGPRVGVGAAGGQVAVRGALDTGRNCCVSAACSAVGWEGTIFAESMNHGLDKYGSELMCFVY